MNLAEPGPVDLGFPRDLDSQWTWGKELGRGGNGVVRIVVNKETGEEFACKSIRKVLKDASAIKKAGHIDSLKREIAVLTRLKGSLNIIKLEAVYEDDDNVHIIQEYCKGGELCHAIGERPYTERTVASYMRAVLRTLAQCHAHHILHRDIKPGNFMLLSKDERAPLKAIDFGLAVPFEPEEMPMTNLGVEGTPWFMAPETLSSQVGTPSDIWSAGVMACQLLTGMLPFDDHKNPFNPSISAIWRSVLNDNVDFRKQWWQGVSDEAKDFVKFLLNRDPAKRPTAKEALKHPWLQGTSAERSTGKRLQQSVVARIQRFSAVSHFKRSVLQMIASELLHHPALSQMETACEIGVGGRPVVPLPTSSCLQPVMQMLGLDKNGTVEASKIEGALRAMGFRLTDTEVERLLEQLDPSGTGIVTREAFAASQTDWRHFQQNHKETWLSLVKQMFSTLDRDQDGVLRVDEIVAHLSKALPESEISHVVEQALEEAQVASQHGAMQGMDFNDFMTMLKVSSVDSLDMYDERFGSTWGNASVDRLNAMLQKGGGSMDRSKHGASLADASHHSDTSTTQTDRSNHTAQMFDMDATHHSQGGSMRAGGAWRFDVGGSGHGLQRAGSGGVGGSGHGMQRVASGGVGGSGRGQQQVQLPQAPAVGPPGGWRFDVGGPPPPAAQPQTLWRFDVAGPAAAAEPPPAPAASAWRFDEPPASPAKPMSDTSASGLARNGGGMFDKRHHGSQLYKNALMVGRGPQMLPRPLETVQE